MKKRNRAEILRLIRQTGCSRAELAKRTGLTRAAVSLIVDECLRLGMLEEGDKILRRLGADPWGCVRAAATGTASG